MSEIDLDTAKKIARLSRLHMDDDEAAQRAKALTGILTWVEQLHEVDTDNVEPLRNVADIELALRVDAVTDGDCAEAVLSNAPEETQGFYVVPKVVE